MRSIINFHQLLDNIPGVVFRCACDADWTMQYISSGIGPLTGFNPDELVGNHDRSFASLIHEEDVQAVEEQVLAAVRENRCWDIEYRIYHRDGFYRWVHESGVAIVEAGEVRFLDGFVFDISERRAMQDALQKSERRVRELAYYDSVTRLPNRNLVFDEIENRIRKSSPFSLFYIDLNDFKPVNDQFGHACGDELLARVGARLRHCIGEGGMVGRIGGDEFMVVCQDDALADAALTAIGEPIEIDGNTVVVTASLGIARFPEHGSTLKDIVRLADEAMYDSKLCRDNGFRKAA